MQCLYSRASRADGQGLPRCGSVIPFVAFGVVAILAMAMFTVDVAYMQLTRTELRVASDAAAKAGASELVRTQNADMAIQAAIDYAARNQVASRGVILRRQDVILGSSTPDAGGKWVFTPGGEPYNAVCVNAAMTSSTPNGAINLFFAPMFNAGVYTPSRTSTASVFQQEVLLVLDRSHSMTFDLSGIDWSYPKGIGSLPNSLKKAPDPQFSRWAALKRAVDRFADIADNVNPAPRVGLVTWASDILPGSYEATITGVTSPVINFELPLAKKNGANLKKETSDKEKGPMLGGTNMSAGIDAGVGVLTAPDVLKYARKSMVLMTDGQWNQGRNPKLAAQDALAKGIVIHTVAFLPGAASADLMQASATTGGRHFQASNEAELIAAFEELARMLPVALTD